MWEIIQYLGLAFIPAFMLLDTFAGKRVFDTPRLFRLRGVLVTVATVALSIAVATFWGTVLEGVSLFDGSALGIWGGALVGVLVYEFFHYWYHRTAHKSGALWRWSHQMHHSTESLDSFGAYYLHPIDTFFFTTWSSLVFFPLLGLQLEAGLLASLFPAFSAMFQHANISTPRWLGYLIQRPESHGIHHERGKHRNNYSDLPLWDMVFGTFDNPRTFEGETGFYKGASSRIGAMLIGRDVSTPAALTPEVESQTRLAA